MALVNRLLTDEEFNLVKDLPVWQVGCDDLTVEVGCSVEGIEIIPSTGSQWENPLEGLTFNQALERAYALERRTIRTVVQGRHSNWHKI